jgi:hypothetical protein
VSSDAIVAARLGLMGSPTSFDNLLSQPLVAQLIVILKFTPQSNLDGILWLLGLTCEEFESTPTGIGETGAKQPDLEVFNLLLTI